MDLEVSVFDSLVGDEEEGDRGLKTVLGKGRPTRVPSRVSLPLEEQPRRTISAAKSDALLMRRQSTFFVDKELVKMPGLADMWAGNLETALHKLQGVTADCAVRDSRQAQAHFIRYWFSARKEDLESAALAVRMARESIKVESGVIVYKLMPELQKLSATMDFVSRTSRRLSVSLPLTARLGLTTVHNPGELRPSELEKDKAGLLDEWKMLQGQDALLLMLSAVCSIYAGRVLRASFDIMAARQIAHGVQKNSEAHSDMPNALGLILGASELWHSDAPWYLRGFVADKPPADRTRTLETICKLADQRGEVHHYAKLMLCSYYILQGGRPFFAAGGAMLKQAEELLYGILDVDWVLFRWAKSRLLRHQKDLEGALRELKYVQSRVPGSGLELDELGLLFALERWEEVDGLLERIDLEDKGYKYVLAACSYHGRVGGKGGDLVGEVPVHKSPWIAKAEAFNDRRNKRLCFYEILYVQGYLGWCDKSRLRRFALELRAMREAEFTYDEEHLTICVLLGVVGLRLDGNARDIQRAMDYLGSCKTDGWHEVCVLYERAVVLLLASDWAGAKPLLERAQTLCSRKAFAYAFVFSDRLRAAILYLNEQDEGVQVKVHSDELGVYTAQDQVSFEPSAMREVVIKKGGKYTREVKVERGDTLNWMWQAQGALQFRVGFVPEVEKTTDDVQEECEVRAGACVRDHFTFAGKGTVGLVWTNPDSLAQVRLSFLVELDGPKKISVPVKGGEQHGHRVGVSKGSAVKWYWKGEGQVRLETRFTAKDETVALVVDRIENTTTGQGTYVAPGEGQFECVWTNVSKKEAKLEYWLIV